MKGKVPADVRDVLRGAYAGQGLFVWSDHDGNDYVLRPISPKLYADLIQALSLKDFKSEYERKDYVNTTIFQKCTLWPEFTPEEYQTIPVGIFPSIAKVAMERSGFINVTVNGDIIGPDVHSVKIQDYTTWPDITEEEIAQLKSENTAALYRVRIDKFVFVIKPVLRSDIQQAAMAADDQLTLVQKITVWPKELDWELVPTGFLDILGEQANRISGWNLDKVEVEPL